MAMTILNQDQLNRCYLCFDFTDEETIQSAYIDYQGQLTIVYLDEHQVVGKYLPFTEPEQMQFIMEGITLTRDEN